MPDAVASDPILDLATPGNLEDPYPALHRLRDVQPLFWYEPLQSWFLTRYADCAAVLRDSERFAADWRRIGEQVPPQAVSIQTLDPPEHTAVRRLVMEAMVRAGTGDVEPLVARHAEQRLAALAGRSTFDFVSDFAAPLVLSTITGQLGVPAPDVTSFAPVATAVLDGMDAGLWPERAEPAMAARKELSELTDGWLDSAPADSVVGRMVARAPYWGVSRQVVANTLRVLLHAGYTSASTLLQLAAVALLWPDNSGLRRYRSAHPPAAVDELVRYASPVQALARACVTGTDLGGVPVSAGDAVTLLLGAANRDPARFTDPDALRLDRHPNPHLGFGRGAHSCLGSPFAATQARVVFAVLADQFPGMRAVAAPSYRQNLTVRSLDRFEVALR